MNDVIKSEKAFEIKLNNEAIDFKVKFIKHAPEELSDHGDLLEYFYNRLLFKLKDLTHGTYLIEVEYRINKTSESCKVKMTVAKILKTSNQRTIGEGVFVLEMASVTRKEYEDNVIF